MVDHQGNLCSLGTDFSGPGWAVPARAADRKKKVVPGPPTLEIGDDTVVAGWKIKRGPPHVRWTRKHKILNTLVTT